MALPRALARFQRSVTNRVLRRVAGHLPGYGLLEHTGRRSGRVYTVPLNVFGDAGGFAILIAYGRESDWVRNVLAAGGARLTHRGRRYDLSAPRIVTGAEARALLPPPVRWMSRIIGAGDVLHVTAVPGA